MKPLRTAVVLALSLSLAVGPVLAEARPTQSSGSYKSGFSSQKSNTARSNNSSASQPSRGGNPSFGSFGSRRAQDAAPPPSSGSNRSAMSRDMSESAARDNAVRSMDSRRAGNAQPLPPLDPVMPRQAPPPQSGYGNNNPGYNNPGYNNPGYDNGRYDNRRYENRPSGWGTAGAAAAGAVLGSVLSGQANAGHGGQQQQQQAPLPGNVPADIGAIGPVDPAADAATTGMAATPAAQDQRQPAPVEAPAARKESSGIGWFGWAMLALIGFGLYRLLTRRKVAKRGANYSLGD
ncbi:hypothetical protein SAMN05216552_100354 [Pseudoduganella namucuonensis]|uniref:MYXO-CTERM domain-containing protein n=2 Tax=Pseudoduganella namucuonensis TaxID=1035707 RepID=A0A1I7G531_9BURK|nr:hypothetical protein SAMN05216552_100354 [Pseudoduganella namucuonensis]